MDIIAKLTKKITDMIMTNDTDKQSQLYNEIGSTGLTKSKLSIHKGKVKSVKKVKTASNEFVYDIGMRNSTKPWYFGNNILIHNSTYFSAYPALMDDITNGTISWEKEDVSAIYDKIANDVSDTFPQFLHDTFNVPIKNSTGIIQSGREVVAITGLFIKKKRYAALVYDDEGKRRDIDGKHGKVKAMGLDLRRSDTPKFIQEFLSEILLDTLLEKGEDHVADVIREFKDMFEDMNPWEKGSPKAVNNLTSYREKEEFAMVEKLRGRKVESFTIPGHVRASLNWNRLRDMHNDNQISPIIDGQRITVCRLRETSDNLMSSIAYPTDEIHLPDWFLSLPFDDEEMMHILITKKVGNLLNVLKWDLDKSSKQNDHFNSLFG